MRQRHFFILGIVIATAIILKFLYWVMPSKTSAVIIRGQTISVEVARTQEEQQEGLSGRVSLAQDRGMLFVYDQKIMPNFWMKGTLLPLDLIWIDNNRIVDITPRVPAPLLASSDKDLPLYTSRVPVTKVLEVNAGTAERFGWMVGDQVEVKL